MRPARAVAIPNQPSNRRHAKMLLPRYHHMGAILCLFLLLSLCLPHTAEAAGNFSFDMGKLGIAWIIPFVCMLLSIAIMPLAIPNIWHHHFGKISAGWGLAFLVPFMFASSFSHALYEFLHAMLLEYMPFIILLLSLFTVAGGIRLKGSLVGTPKVNTGILLIGTALASWMGTTGAAMLLIRPLIRANAHRTNKTHTVVFFIFLVANIGGSLTPLGDPPLFLGFLNGVPFFWTLTGLFLPMLVASLVLLALYFCLDSYLYAKEGRPVPPDANQGEKLGLEGTVNFILLAAIVGSVLLSGVWKSSVSCTIYHITLELQNIVRDILLLCIAYVSWIVTSRESRRLNAFTWGPIEEVAKLFFGIFVSMIPAIAILRAGKAGALSSVIDMVSRDGKPINAMYFWLTGGLSSFLDNAPTYLVFFNTAGGNAAELTTTLAPTLIAIAAGAVFMGANTYIGNAPNFMVRSIAEEQGVPMPSFFGYMLWSCGILIPLFIALTFIFF